MCLCVCVCVCVRERDREREREREREKNLGNMSAECQRRGFCLEKSLGMEEGYVQS